MTTDGTTAPAAKTYTEKDIEIERANAQHFKQLADEAAAAIKKYQGVDIDALKAAAAEAERLKNSAALGDPKKLEERINEAKTAAEAEISKRYADKLSELEKERETQARELHKLRVTQVGITKALEVGFLPEAKRVVERELDERCMWQDGKIVVRGDDGKPMYSKVNPRELMDVEEFLRQFGNENAYLMKPSTARGTSDGKEKGSTATGAPIRWPDFRSMSPDQQTAWFDANPEARKAFAENGFRIP